MRKYLDIHGKDVFTLENKVLGFIDNGFIDFKSHKLTSIIISDGRFFPKLYIVPFSNIVFRKDKVCLSSRPFRLRRKILNKNIRYSIEGFIGREIVNNEGLSIGEVDDVILDETTGEFKAIICKRGFYDDLLRGKKVMIVNEGITIKEDKVLSSKSSIEMICEISFKNDFEEVE